MRLQLFEWEDLAWFPASMRTAMTSYLAASYGFSPIPALWAECLARSMRKGDAADIVDLGSGSGGPIPRVVKELLEVVGVTLTDLFPPAIAPLCA